MTTIDSAQKPRMSSKAVSGHHHASSNDEPSCVLQEGNPYDVHVYYGNAKERQAAMELRKRMQRQFGEWMIFHNPHDRPIGPHPIPMWEADFGGNQHQQKWSLVRDFLSENNPENLSILIHPHSMDGPYADHTKNAFWVGDAIKLRLRG